MNTRDPLQEHYRLIAEDARLDAPLGQLEFIRSLSVLNRHLPDAPAVIADIGGATGRYSIALAEQGYRLHLIDVVAKHIEQARRNVEERSVELESMTVSDARALPLQDNSCDVVLLFGPLYHLTEIEERGRSLLEAHRVLKPGGLVFGAGIMRYASLYDGLSRGFIQDPYFREILFQDLINGRHRNPREVPSYFTDTQFHLPDEMEREFISAGFQPDGSHAVEGPAWMWHDFDERWRREEERKALLEVLEQTDRHESLLLLTQHFITVARLDQVA